MKKIKMLFLGVLAISGIAVFTAPVSAADWRDYRRAEINREYREALRRREAYRYARNDHFWNRGWRDRYDYWRDHNRW